MSGASAPSSRTALLVLGMHRSGTSALTGALGLRGVPLPAHLMEADEGNPRGYFESQRIYALHEELLASVGSAWDDVAFRADRRLAGTELERWTERFAEAVREDFADAPLFVLKDPRICRLLPLWTRVLGRVGAEPVAVLVVRHPLEVCRSLERAHGTPLGTAALLWLQHVLAAEADSRPLRRTLLRYADLLSGGSKEVERVVADLELPLQPLEEEATRSLEAFLSGDLRHHAAGARDLDACPEVPRWVKATYRILAEAHRLGADDLVALDRIRGELEEAEQAFGDALAGASGLRRHAQQLEARLARREAALEELERRAKTLVERAASLEQHTVNLEGELERRAERLAELERHGQNLEGELERIRGELASQERRAEAERRRSRERIEALEAHAGGLEAELGRREERIAGLEEHAGNLEAELDRRERRIASLDAHAENLQTELARGGERIASLERHGANLETALRDRDERLGVLEPHAAALEVRLGELREELETIRSTLWFRVWSRLRGRS